jgi:hypothetical protein
MKKFAAKIKGSLKEHGIQLATALTTAVVLSPLAMAAPVAGGLNDPTAIVKDGVCKTVVKWGTDPVMISVILVGAGVFYFIGRAVGNRNASMVMSGAATGAVGLLCIVNIVTAFTGASC